MVGLSLAKLISHSSILGSVAEGVIYENKSCYAKTSLTSKLISENVNCVRAMRNLDLVMLIASYYYENQACLNNVQWFTFP